MNESEYVSKRLNSSRDDRQDCGKKMNDGKLRGSIGVNKANRVIKMVNEHKSRR